MAFFMAITGYPGLHHDATAYVDEIINRQYFGYWGISAYRNNYLTEPISFDIPHGFVYRYIIYMINIFIKDVTISVGLLSVLNTLLATRVQNQSKVFITLLVMFISFGLQGRPEQFLVTLLLIQQTVLAQKWSYANILNSILLGLMYYVSPVVGVFVAVLYFTELLNSIDFSWRGYINKLVIYTIALFILPIVLNHESIWSYTSRWLLGVLNNPDYNYKIIENKNWFYVTLYRLVKPLYNLAKNFDFFIPAIFLFIYPILTVISFNKREVSIVNKLKDWSLVMIIVLLFYFFNLVTYQWIILVLAFILYKRPPAFFKLKVKKSLFLGQLVLFATLATLSTRSFIEKNKATKELEQFLVNETILIKANKPSMIWIKEKLKSKKVFFYEGEYIPDGKSVKVLNGFNKKYSLFRYESYLFRVTQE